MKKFYYLALALAGLFIGGQKLYIRLSESEATEITQQQFLSKGTSKQWLNIKNAKFALEESNYSYGLEGVKEIYIPLLPLTENQKMKYILISKDPKIIEILNAAVNKSDDYRLKGSALVNSLNHFNHNDYINARVSSWGEVKETVTFFLDDNPKIDPRPIYLIHNSPPSFELPLGLIGVAILLLFYAFHLHKKSSVELPEPQNRKTPPKLPTAAK